MKLLLLWNLFEDLTALKVLSLNSNKVTSLLKCSFSSLNNLFLLNLLNNNILFVDKTIFGSTKIGLIITDDFPVCCMYLTLSLLLVAYIGITPDTDGILYIK